MFLSSKMSTDVTVTAGYRTERFAKSLQNTCSAEVKSGFLVLLRPASIRQDVRVVVYCTTQEHFAVIYPRKRLTKSIGVVNLKNTLVERAEKETGFTVRQKGYDNTVCAKFLCSCREVESWISAFTSRASPASQHYANILPVLVEDEETCDN